MKNPGDYFATTIGRKPIVLVRDADGAIRVIHNPSAHRGALMVATECGNAAEFTCCCTAGPATSTAGSSECRCSTDIRAISVLLQSKVTWLYLLGRTLSSV